MIVVEISKRMLFTGRCRYMRFYGWGIKEKKREFFYKNIWFLVKQNFREYEKEWICFGWFIFK